MRRTFAVLLSSACLVSCGIANHPNATNGVMLRVPEDVATISAAVSAGATIIEIGAGEFDLDDLQLFPNVYTIRGRGPGQTTLRGSFKERVADQRSSVAFNDLSLVFPHGADVNLRSADVYLSHVSLQGRMEVHANFDVRDSVVLGELVAHRSLLVSHSKISSQAHSAIEFVPVEIGNNSLNITDSYIAGSQIAMNIIFVTAIEVSIRHTVISSNTIGARLFCGIMNPIWIEPERPTGSLSDESSVSTISAPKELFEPEIGKFYAKFDGVIFYGNKSNALKFELFNSKEVVSRCGKLVVSNSMFVENRGVAVSAAGVELTAVHNLFWRNAGGSFENWSPQDPIIEVDPMFVDPAQGDFRLRAGSPALAAGIDGIDLGVRSAPEATPAPDQGGGKAAGPVPVRAAPKVREGRKLALVVGVQDFRDPAIKRLKYARSDAESVAQYLRKAGYTVTLLTEAAASLTAVKTALVGLTQAGPADSLFIYFSTHGSGEPNPLGSGRGFLLLHEAQASSIPSTALSVQDLQAAIDRTASERVTLIMDSCFSGGASEHAKSIWSPVNSKGDGASITGPIAYGRGKIGLFSSRDNEASFEADEFKHGYFTYHLLQAWGRGLRNLDEVYGYVLREVRNSTNGQQHPGYSSAQAEGQAPTF